MNMYLRKWLGGIIFLLIVCFAVVSSPRAVPSDRYNQIIFSEKTRVKEPSWKDRLAERINDPRLLARGQRCVYSGKHLTAINFPLGGIGSGCVQINGKAERAIWQIFNNFQGVFVPNSFFAVRAKFKDGQPIVRVLQTTEVGPFKAMKRLNFCGEYPFAWYEFEDAELPLALNIETFSPLIPLNARDSAIPCAIFNLTAENTSNKTVEVSFLATQQNAVGLTDDGKVEGRHFSGYGGNSNRVLKENGATILHMTADRKADASTNGDMALAAFENKVLSTASWDSINTLLKSISHDDMLGVENAGPSPIGQTLDGALAIPFALNPGQRRTVTFVLTWYFPNTRHGRKQWGGKGNMYTNWWDSALSVMREIHKRFKELDRLTRLYHDTFYTSNLPHWLLDRISSQVAVLRSKTCFWTKNSYFGGWEGCCPASGCCHGNCAHVWHYAQSHARLFPSIARRMRQQALHCQLPNGGIPFRIPKGNLACDGQCGEILEAYREHLNSIDGMWLHHHWPRIKKAMEYAIKQWDQDKDGVLAGAQHNTLDCKLGGSSSWLGTLYLAALRASEKMAELEGDSPAAEHYRRIHKSGAKKQNETLWNGEYYIQIPDSDPQWDYNNGCHIDQVLGQWWAHQLNLGWLYSPDRVRMALRALLKYNFQDKFYGIAQKPRKFVDDNDAGTQMIIWPKGDRPANPMKYASEVMTGFEYSAAATMVQADMLKEGLMLVRAVADRYDGQLRTGLAAKKTATWGYSGNPFGDDECGKFYARAMSVWSMLLACQGFIYDGPAGVIGFKPVWNAEDHASFFTAAESWGLFKQKREGTQQRETIDVRWGQLCVRELVFAIPKQFKLSSVRVTVAGRTLPVRYATNKDDKLTIGLTMEAIIQADQKLEIDINLF